MDEIEEVDMMDTMERAELEVVYDHFNNNRWFESPPSPPFHGFDPSEIPRKLVITTKVLDKEEVFGSIRRAEKRGRRGDLMVEDLNTSETRRAKLVAADPPSTLRSEKPSIVTPKVSQGGTGSRPIFYLVGSTLPKFKFSKLPLTGALLGRFLINLENRSSKEAAALTRVELKAVWLHHFSIKLVHGRELGIEEEDDEKSKIIKQDRFIDNKIIKVWNDWRKLELESRRPDRASSANFLKKEDGFKEFLKKPFDISKVAAEEIIKTSGIKDWKEEAEHLKNQLSEQQVGCPGSIDQKQKKRDQRIIKGIQTAGEADQKKVAEDEDLKQRKKKEREDAGESEIIDNNNDGDFIGPKRKQHKKIDIMGKITLTSDRVNVSYQGRAMIAASTANALGVDINDTNISKTTAWRKAHEVRTKTSAFIKEGFQCPDKVTAHWDEKTVTLKGNEKSSRVCVYLTAADAEQTRKLLAVPETPTGTGHDEAKVVTDTLENWGVEKEVIGMVFDTTSSNTGVEIGACKFVEVWRKTAILWLACSAGTMLVSCIYPRLFI